MNTQQQLDQTIHAAYSASVMGRGSLANAVQAFKDYALINGEIIAAAQAELGRAQGASGQCFVSKVTAEFLRQALASTSDIAAAIAAAAAEQQPAQSQDGSDDMASKLKALTGLAKDAHANVEAEAERAASRLVKATESAKVGIGKLDHISKDIEASAADLEGFANTVSNFPPADDATQKKK